MPGAVVVDDVGAQRSMLDVVFLSCRETSAIDCQPGRGKETAAARHLELRAMDTQGNEGCE